MKKIEAEGVVFVAEDRVPASYFEEYVENLTLEDIEDIKEECDTEKGFDITFDWDRYIKNIKEEMEDFISFEEEDVIQEIEKCWREVREAAR